MAAAGFQAVVRTKLLGLWTVASALDVAVVAVVVAVAAAAWEAAAEAIVAVRRQSLVPLDLCGAPPAREEALHLLLTGSRAAVPPVLLTVERTAPTRVLRHHPVTLTG